MKSISILSLLLTLSLISLAAATLETPTTTTATATGNLVEKACSNSTQKAVCLSVLNSAPNATTSDLKGLAFIALKNASETAANTSRHIKSLLVLGGINEPKLEDGLDSCSDYYLDVVDQIDDSIDMLISKKFDDVKTEVNAAIADVSTCNDDMKGLSAPAAKDMVERNRIIRDLCKNALEVASVFYSNTN